ncbi:hypothetical protein [Paenibacillus oleatilyticus]|uniref:DUF4878 domain-containing protein n=1 Tax=Paenibacillus oleatilyticus TaxID=2594886 RepID=A0ABV4UVL7_9BACL
MKKITSAILVTALGVTMLSGPAMAAEPVSDTAGNANNVLTAVQTQKYEEEAKQSVQNYIKAIERKDVEEMTKWVKDTRFQSFGEQKQEYQKMFDVNPFSEFKIVDVKTRDEKTANVAIELTRKDTKQIEKVELPIIKDNDSKWRLVLGDAETRDQNSITNGRVESQKIISPASSSVAYYEFFLYKKGEIILPTKAYSTSSFNMTGTSITINGWQQSTGSNTPVYVEYQIVVKGFFSDDVKGSFLLNGYFPKTNTDRWYSYTISTSSPVQGAHLKIVNASAEIGCDGAGNVYQ